MAKRAPKDEKPFNPIESALVERVTSRLPIGDRFTGSAGMVAALEEASPLSPARNGRRAKSAYSSRGKRNLLCSDCSIS
jgi:hypothetical protein